MAKPPVDTFEKMINFLQTQLRSKKFVANYQPVMIKFLLQNGNQSKRQIAQQLWIQNNKKSPAAHQNRLFDHNFNYKTVKFLKFREKTNTKH